MFRVRARRHCVGGEAQASGANASSVGLVFRKLRPWVRSRRFFPSILFDATESADLRDHDPVQARARGQGGQQTP